VFNGVSAISLNATVSASFGDHCFEKKDSKQAQDQNFRMHVDVTNQALPPAVVIWERDLRQLHLPGWQWAAWTLDCKPARTQDRRDSTVTGWMYNPPKHFETVAAGVTTTSPNMAAQSLNGPCSLTTSHV
jgi:hypothetical protein